MFPRACRDRYRWCFGAIALVVVIGVIAGVATAVLATGDRNGPPNWTGTAVAGAIAGLCAITSIFLIVYSIHGHTRYNPNDRDLADRLKLGQERAIRREEYERLVAEAQAKQQG
jgi:hypothetical protein